MVSNCGKLEIELKRAKGLKTEPSKKRMGQQEIELGGRLDAKTAEDRMSVRIFPPEKIRVGGNNVH